MQSNLFNQPLIELRDVVKVYATAAGEFNALKGINMQVERGEFVGVIGKSGAGKSTLLNMITGVDHLTSGEVIVTANGSPVSIHKMKEDEIAFWRGHHLGVVFQSFQLLPMLTLVENIMLPIDLCGKFNPKQSRERALELLRLVEIEGHADKFPAHISGGQQQRVAIARALANDPPILVAEDEPLVRLSIVDALEEGGYTVLEAKDGADAIKQMDQQDRLRGLVTDIRLGPGPSGWEVAHHAREKFPNLAVVYVTGDSGREWTANGVPQSTVLQKPFASAELVTAVASLLVAQKSGPPAS